MSKNNFKWSDRFLVVNMTISIEKSFFVISLSSHHLFSFIWEDQKKRLQKLDGVTDIIILISSDIHLSSLQNSDKLLI